MKILKKAKLLPVTCELCGCVFLPKAKDLKYNDFRIIKDVVRCPICSQLNYAKFEKEE